MNIGFISDLHLDNIVQQLNDKGEHATLQSLLTITINEFKNKEIDLCIISGDISNELSLTKEIVRKLNKSNIKVYYTLGNHDLWMRDKQIETELKLIMKDDNCLLNKFIEIDNNYVLVGMYSWYDPSFETLGYEPSYYELQKQLWIDSKYISWTKQTNEEVVQNQLAQTKKILNEIPHDKHIILVNHFVPHHDFIIHKENNDNWNFGNAFMGSQLIDQLVKEDSRIKYVTFGHSHYQFGKVKKDNITYLSFPLGYVHEWSETTYKKQFEKTLGIININK